MEIITITAVSFIVVLALAAISGSIIERSGTINLSIEAFMILGGLNYALIANHFKSMHEAHQIWILLCSGLIPLLFGYIYGLLTVTLKANQTIAGIALNTFALAVALFLITTRINPGFNESTQFISFYDDIWHPGAHTKDFKKIFNAGVIMGVIIIALLILVLNKTKLGIKIKTVGENPQAAASLGMNVVLIRYIAILISSFLTGVAGAIFFQTTSSQFDGNTKGVGFLAVAMVIFGQWRPTYIILASVLFGYLYTFAENNIISPLGGKVPADLFMATPYIITIFILTFTQRNSKSPKALGIPFETQGR